MTVFLIAMSREAPEETSQPFRSSTTAITEKQIAVRGNFSPFNGQGGSGQEIQWIASAEFRKMATIGNFSLITIVNFLGIQDSCSQRWCILVSAKRSGKCGDSSQLTEETYDNR